VFTLRVIELRRAYDIAVFGSGFAGSLMAMIAKRQGYSVILLERGRHPRMAIGESSTPLANLLLEQLAERYNLPAIRPLAKWGSWQRTYPHVACGLKRGFTFYYHEPGTQVEPDRDHLRQLLVAASPHDEIADTHWYRADFDSFLVDQAQSIGVDYLDKVRIDCFVAGRDEVSFDVSKDGETVEFRAGFVVDATGPRGLLHRALLLPEEPLPDYPATQALYSHFSGVRRPDASMGQHNQQAPPYPAEDAAVHHVFDGGWIWVLRFNNGMTSAGVAATEEASICLNLREGQAAWWRLIDSIPTLKEQFATARAEVPFTFTPHLSFLSSRVCGPRWAMLPSAAGFIDPLLSTGFPLTLLGVDRLAEILDHHWDSSSFSSQLESYALKTREELLATSQLIGSLYANMNNFRVFKAISLLYFVAASHSETVRRLGRPHLAQSFLLQDDSVFGPTCRGLLERARRLTSEQESTLLVEGILHAIEPFDVAGLSNPDRRSWYPVDAEDLLRSASKVQSTREEVENLLQKCGFYSTQQVSPY
jgi:tetracycline 7-halogenase / FADH2 O2-dependent halogenase